MIQKTIFTIITTMLILATVGFAQISNTMTLTQTAALTDNEIKDIAIATYTKINDRGMSLDFTFTTTIIKHENDGSYSVADKKLNAVLWKDDIRKCVSIAMSQSCIYKSLTNIQSQIQQQLYTTYISNIKQRDTARNELAASTINYDTLINNLVMNLSNDNIINYPTTTTTTITTTTRPLLTTTTRAAGTG